MLWNFCIKVFVFFTVNSDWLSGDSNFARCFVKWWDAVSMFEIKGREAMFLILLFFAILWTFTGPYNLPGAETVR